MGKIPLFVPLWVFVHLHLASPLKGEELRTGKACQRKGWRERMGVEPTGDGLTAPQTDLKSAKPTGTYPLPFIIILAKKMVTYKD
jgi:hypothetical protein